MYTLNIIGPPPALSERAREQLASLAGDYEQGLARRRVITRVRNKLEAELAILAPKHKVAERNTASLRARAEAYGGPAADALPRFEDELSNLSKKVTDLRERISALNTEGDSIRAWTDPTGRFLDGVYAHAGVKEIRHLLPDFGWRVDAFGKLA